MYTQWNYISICVGYWDWDWEGKVLLILLDGGLKPKALPLLEWDSVKSSGWNATISL